MTYDELGQRIKNKYPQYKQMDDKTVGQLVAQKYPEYAKLITKGGVNNWASNVPVLSQVQDFGLGVGSAVGKAVTGAGEAVSKLGAYASKKAGFEGGQKFFDATSKGFKKTGEALYEKPLEKNLESISGKAGNVAGTIAPYFVGGGVKAGVTGVAKAKNLLGIAGKDTAIAAAQTGGDVATSGVTGLTSLVANRLLPGAGAGIRQRVASGAIPGYVGDVGMGLAGERGENRSGLGAFVPGAGTAFGTAVGTATAVPLLKSKTERLQNKRYNTLDTVQRNNASLDRQIRAADRAGIDTKKFLAETDLLVGAVDSNGTINSKVAIKNMQQVMAPFEDRVGKVLQDEGATISGSALRKKLYAVIDDSGLIGTQKQNAIARADAEIDALLMDYGEGIIPLSAVHELKVQMNKTNAKSYIDPEKNLLGKTLTRGLKETVEETTQAMDVKTYNQELRKMYAVIDVLKALDRKKVEGGRLGKHFASVIGTMVGSQVGGPVGGVIGAEAGAKLKGIQMSGALGGKGGKEVTPSATLLGALQSNKLGSRQTSQATTIAPTKSVISSSKAQPKGASTDLSTATRQGVQKTSSPKSTTRPVSVAKEELKRQIEGLRFMEEMLDDSRIKPLVNKVGKGDSTLAQLQENAIRRKSKGNKDWRKMEAEKANIRRYDNIEELGFKDLDEAQEALERYYKDKQKIANQKEYIKNLREQIKRGEDVVTYDDPRYHGSTERGMINPSAIASDIKAGARKAVDYVKKKVDFGNPEKERGMINPGAMADDMKGGAVRAHDPRLDLKINSEITLDGTPYKVEKIFTNGAGNKSVTLSNKLTGREMTMPLRDLPENSIKKTNFISSDMFFGKNAKIKGRANQPTYQPSIDYLKGEIRNGARPKVSISDNPYGKGLTVSDGNHTLEAYKQLGVKEIPIIDYSEGRKISQLRAEWDAVSTSDKIRAIPEPAPKVPKQITPQEKDEILSMLDYIRTSKKYDKQMTEMIDRYARRFGFNPSAKKLDEQLEAVMLNAKIAPLPGGTRGR